MQQILHVVVVGFHHKKGCQVEFAHPPLTGTGECGLPEEWSCLPTLAIPDGSHNSTNDTVYFTLPSYENPETVIFGISCYRQIATKDLISKEEDVSRNTVQKSVCILSRAPLYGVLKAKLQLITQAYFNELDFSRVEVLSQMYTNLCEMFAGDLVDGQAASMELLEEGLQFSSYQSKTQNTLPVFEIPVADKTEDGEIVIGNGTSVLKDDPIKATDTYGFPLSIFTKGNSFLPYVPLPLLDTIKPLQSFVAGATNALFAMKKETFDAIITINEVGAGNVEFVDVDLKKNLFLTSADLRFGDYILKSIENKSDPSIFEGGDEWIRIQMKNYLLFLIATTRSSLNSSVGDFGAAFIAEWKTTNNYRVLTSRVHDDLSCVPPGHPFAGQIGLGDVLLRMEHNVSGSRNARKALTAITTTGKNLGETGMKVKQSLSNWLKGAEIAEDSLEGHDRNNILTRPSSSTTLADDLTQRSRETPFDEGISSKVKAFTSWWKRETPATPEARSEEM